MLSDGKHIPVGIFEPSNFVAALGTAGKMRGYHSPACGKHLAVTVLVSRRRVVDDSLD